MNLALGVPFGLAAAGWRLGTLLFVPPAPVGPFAVVLFGLVALDPVVLVALPYLSPCLYFDLGLWFALPLDVL